MIRINLLAPERTRKAAAPTPSGGGGGASSLPLALLLGLFVGGALLLCAAGWWLQKTKLESLDRQIKADEARQKELQAIQAQVDEFQKKKAQLENTVLVIERLRLSQKSPVHMLDEISKALPDYVWLTDYSESRGAVTFTGESNSLAAVADFMNGLQRSGWFPAVELASAKEDRNLVGFALSGRFVDPDVAAKEAALAKTTAAQPTPPGRRAN